MKYAIEFKFTKSENEFEHWNEHLMCDDMYVPDWYDFDVDYWEMFFEEKELEKIPEGSYYVFAYGELTISVSQNWYGEYECEVIFEPEHTHMEVIVE